MNAVSGFLQMQRSQKVAVFIVVHHEAVILSGRVLPQLDIFNCQVAAPEITPHIYVAVVGDIHISRKHIVIVLQIPGPPEQSLRAKPGLDALMGLCPSVKGRIAYRQRVHGEIGSLSLSPQHIRIPAPVAADAHRIRDVVIRKKAIYWPHMIAECTERGDVGDS